MPTAQIRVGKRADPQGATSERLRSDSAAAVRPRPSVVLDRDGADASPPTLQAISVTSRPAPWPSTEHCRAAQRDRMTVAAAPSDFGHGATQCPLLFCSSLAPGAVRSERTPSKFDY